MYKVELRNGLKVIISRRRTKIVAYENMPVVRKISDSVSSGSETEKSRYSRYNYNKRLVKRREMINSICYNSFDISESVFVTLTFDPEKFAGKNAGNIDVTHNEFKKFIKRVNSKYQGFTYLGTFSLQKNGNWHYHMICNWKRNTLCRDIEAIWKNGRVNIKKMENENDFKKYINYLIKNMEEAADILKGKKGYLCSRNVQRDIVLDSGAECQSDEDWSAAENEITKTKVTKMYETRKSIGIKTVSAEYGTGEVHEGFVPGAEITDELKNDGFEECIVKYEAYRCESILKDKFTKPEAAVLKKPKN